MTKAEEIAETIISLLTEIRDELRNASAPIVISGADDTDVVSSTEKQQHLEETAMHVCSTCGKTLPESEFYPSELVMENARRCKRCKDKEKSRQTIDRWGPAIERLLSVGGNAKYVKKPDRWTNKRLAAIFGLSPTTMDDIMRCLYNDGRVTRKMQNKEYVFFLPGTDNTEDAVEIKDAILETLPTKTEADLLAEKGLVLNQGTAMSVAESLHISDSHASVTLERMVESGIVGFISVNKKTKWGGFAKKLYYRVHE